MKLYCKCKRLTPGVTVLIPVAHGLRFSIYLSCSAHNWNLSRRGGATFLIIYIHVSSLLATGTFGFQIWLLIQRAL